MSVEPQVPQSPVISKKRTWIDFGIRFIAVILALVFTSLILVMAKAQPWEAFTSILKGAFGSTIKFTSVVASWVPLVIATSGLLFTFTAGLWNIGMEGQIITGAIFTVGAFRLLDGMAIDPTLVILLAFIAGALGGILWALLPGLMKIYGGVNEIFGGLGLNFVAKTIAIWLIFGPWKRPGVASGSGTEWIDIVFRLPYLKGTNLNLSILIIALLIVVFTAIMLKGTHIGLRLKAIGKNDKAAYLLGIPTTRYFLFAFGMCGLFAGVAGAILVTSKQYSLIPDAGFGYGFLGLLVAMLVNYHPILAPIVAVFFAALSIGNTELQYIGLNSYFAGVLQGFMVLFVVLVDGIKETPAKEIIGDLQMDLAILTTLAGIVEYAVPVLFASIGENITEKAGVTNLSVNGTIILSAMGGFVAALTTNSILLGFLAGALIGGAVAAIVAFSSITLKQSQVAIGFILALLCRDLAYFLGAPYTNKPGIFLSKVPIPGLSEIPIIGPILFNHSLVVYASYVFIIIAYLFMFKTRPGLMLQGIGERPAAAFARGANVKAMRYVYTILGGALVGLAGPMYSLAVKIGWAGQLSGLDGIGWIALAITIFGGWNPVRVAFGAYLFGGLQQLGITLQSTTDIPIQILQAAPFPLMIFTLLLVNVGRAEWVERELAAMPEKPRKLLTKILRALRTSPPASLGIPFENE